MNVQDETVPIPLPFQPEVPIPPPPPPPSADRELTSPSRLVTHDSTGSGSKQQQAAKRRRTSAGPAGSAPYP